MKYQNARTQINVVKNTRKVAIARKDINIQPGQENVARRLVMSVNVLIRKQQLLPPLLQQLPQQQQLLQLQLQRQLLLPATATATTAIQISSAGKKPYWPSKCLVAGLLCQLYGGMGD